MPGMGGPGGKRGYAKPKNAKQVFKRILSYIGKNKALLFVVFIMLILSTLCTTGASYWLKPICCGKYKSKQLCYCRRKTIS